MATSSSFVGPLIERLAPAILGALTVALIVELPLMLLVPGTALGDPALPQIARLAAAFAECALVGALFAPAFWLSEVRGRRGSWAQRKWWLLPCFFWLSVVLVALLLSWALQFSVGQFLSADALALAVGNGSQLLKHGLEFSPWVVVAFGPVLIFLLWICWCCMRARLFVVAPRRVAQIASIIYLVAFCAVGATWYKMSSAHTPRSHRVTGEIASDAQRWSRALRKRTGPGIAFFASLFPQAVGGVERYPAPALRLPEEKRERLSLSQYTRLTSPSANRYNVILVLVESLRADTLTALGSKRIVMPHLEGLARRSLVLSRAYAAATHSSYSDPTTLSSQYPLRALRYRDYPRQIPYPRVLLYDLLKPRNYTTAIISSQNELWGGMLHYIRTPSLDHLFHSETYHENYVEESDSGFARWARKFKRSGKVDDKDTMSELVRFIKDQKQNFFVYSNLQNSHFPYRYPQPERAPFQPQAVHFNYTFSHFPKKHVATVINRYHNALNYVDTQLGRLFAALDEQELWNETILIITGDTGQAFFEHGRASHASTPYEELIHIPVVIFAPQLHGSVSERLCSQVDIPPTVLDLLGMPPHPGFQGRSILDQRPPAPVFTMVHVPARRELAVVSGHHKLIIDGLGKRELYDLDSDPSEKENLWAARKKLGQRLLNVLLSYRKSQLDYYGSRQRWQREYPPVLRVP